MLKFLTHKLRTHSLNEDNVSEKIDSHDSGTESDDEVETPDSEQRIKSTMKWQDMTDINMSSLENACTPHYSVSDDFLYDHHSSEEELEVINGAPSEAYAHRGARGIPPEKRKWENDENESGESRAHTWDSNDSGDSRSQTPAHTPVRFRTSPPLEALKPRRPPRHRAASPLALHNTCVCPAPAKLRHISPSVTDRPPADSVPLASQEGSFEGRSYPIGGRKRSRHNARRTVARPALDFDKMQQLKVRTATAWRHHSEHGAELSVFCW